MVSHQTVSDVSISIGGTATSTEWLDFEDLNSFTYCSRNNPPTFATNGAIDPNDGYGCREYR